MMVVARSRLMVGSIVARVWMSSVGLVMVIVTIGDNFAERHVVVIGR